MCPVMLALQGCEVPGNPRCFGLVGQRLCLASSPDPRVHFMADPRGILMKANVAFIRLGR